MNRKIWLAVFFVGSLLSLSVALSAAPLPVAVSILPQKWLAEQVGGDLVSTLVLVDRGQEPHAFQPTPKQIAALYRAKIYFTVDLPFEREIIRKIKQSGSAVQLVDVTAAVSRIAISGGAVEKEGDNRAAGLDPHVWLAPENLIQMARAMADALASTDPVNKSVYEANFKKAATTLEQLNARNKQLLAPYRGATFFVFHPAFGYFAHAYDLHQQAVEVAGKSPSPRQLRSLIQKARADKVKVIFVQPQFDPKSAQAIARAIGGAVVPLDPLAEDVIGNLTIMADKMQSALLR